MEVPSNWNVFRWRFQTVTLNSSCMVLFAFLLEVHPPELIDTREFVPKKRPPELDRIFKPLFGLELIIRYGIRKHKKTLLQQK